MQLNLRTVSVFLAESLSLIGALWILGYPVKRAVDRISGRRSIVLTPLFGLWPLMSVSWFWSSYSHDGLHAVLWWALAAFVVIDVVLLARRMRGTGMKLARRNLTRSVAFYVPIIGVIAIVYIFLYRHFFSLGYQTPASLGNLDLGYFAIGAEHLRRFGLNDPGNLVAINLGAAIKHDTTGTFFLDLFAPVLWSRPVWETTNATLFTGVVLTSCQVAVVLRRVATVNRKTAVAIASFVMLSPLTVYCIAQGYLSQVWAAGLMIAGIGVMARVQKSRSRCVSAALQLGLIVSILWYMYPFAAFAVLALGLATGALVQRPLVAPRAFVWLILAAIAGVVVSVVLTPTRIDDAIHISVTQSNASAGWKLPAIYPHELLGFTSSFTANAFATPFRKVGLIPVAILTICGLAFGARRRQGRFAAAGVVVSLATYVAIYTLDGPSYQQWKWAAFVNPLLVASFALLMIETLLQFMRNAKATDARWMRATAVGIVVPVFLFAYAWNDFRLTHVGFIRGANSLYITPETVSASRSPLLQRSQPIMVDDNPPWNVMWLIAMTPDMKNYPPGFKYTDAIRASNMWRLVGNNALLPPSNLVSKQTVNDYYNLELLHTGTTSTMHVEQITRADDNLDWTLEVTNTSHTAWDSPSQDSTNGVSLQATFIRDVPDTAVALGQDNAVAVPVANDDPATVVPLPSGTTVAPGASYAFSGTTPITGSPAQIQFDLQQPNTGPFEIWTPATIATVPSR